MACDWLDGAAVAYVHGRVTMRPKTIYAGVEPQDAFAGLNAISDGHALVVTHKRPRAAESTRPRSCARFVAQASDRTDWLATIGLMEDQQRPFAGATIVADDASPDTCLALVTLARAAAGKTVPTTWIDYADKWEQGLSPQAASHYSSWGALHSALTHPLFNTSSQKSERDAGVDAALRVGCRFVEGLIEANQHPEQIDASDALDDETRALVERARALLQVEQNAATHIREIGEVVQLVLEIEGSTRRQLVDGVIVTEDRSLTGALKVFLRNDASSPSGQGYAFLALHRPTERGSGSDITLSVDPRARVQLRDVWEALEQSEWRAWQDANEQRPADAPRKLLSYQRPAPQCQLPLPADIQPANEPWYDGGPLYTLIGAPRAFDAENKHLGSKLSWADVLHILWRTSSPARLFDFRSRSNPAKEVDLIEDKVDSGARRPLAGLNDLWMVDLTTGDRADRNLLFWNDTVARSIAAFIAEGKSELLRLPRMQDFDVVRGSGGVVVVSRDGVAVVQISPDVRFPLNEITMAIERAAKTIAAARALELRLERARYETSLAIAGASGGKKSQAIASLYAILREALDQSAPFQKKSPDPIVSAIEDQLEKHWDARARFDAVIAQARELRDMTAAASDIRTNEIVHAVAVYGFPFALVVNLFAFAFAEDDSFLRGWDYHGIEVGAVVAWIGSGLVIAAALHVWVLLRNRRWRRQVQSEGEEPRRERNSAG